MSATICFLDPGVQTGVAIFDLAIPSYLVEVGTIKDAGTLADYCDKLAKMKAKYAIEIAVIEGYQNFGKRFYNAAKVQQQIRACQDVFKTRIMLKTGQWNPRHFTDTYKKQLVASIFHTIKSNCHQRDAMLMGDWYGNWVSFWARYCQIKPAEMSHIVAAEFGHIPRQGEMQGWAEEFNHKKKPIFALDSEFGDYGRKAVAR